MHPNVDPSEKVVWNLQTKVFKTTMTSATKVARVTRVTSAMRATVTKVEVTKMTARERGRMLLIRKNVFRELEPITSLGKFLFKECLLITFV